MKTGNDSMNKNNNQIYFIGIGILLYSISLLFKDQFSSIQNAILVFSGHIIVFISIIKQRYYRISNSWFLLIMTSYFLWQFTIVIRGLDVKYSVITHFFFNPYFFLPFLIPLIIFIGYGRKLIMSIFSVITIYNLIFILLYITKAEELLYFSPFQAKNEELNVSLTTFFEISSKFLILQNGFLLLTFSFLKFHQRIISIAVFLINAYIALYLARRNIIYTLSLFLIFSIMIQWLRTHKSIYKKLLFIIAGVILTIIGFYIFSFYSDSRFYYLLSRINSDSRSYVVDYFIKDFSILDWIFGRGMNGSYYIPNFENQGNYRTALETGFLYLVLKGGVVNLCLYLIILIRSVYLGLLKSNSIYLKACGFYVLVSMLDLYPSGVPIYSFRFILLWILIGFCNSDRLRRLDDLEIFQEINSKLIKNGRWKRDKINTKS